VSIQKQRSSLNQGIKGSSLNAISPRTLPAFILQLLNSCNSSAIRQRDFLLEPSRALARWVLNHSWGKAGREEQAAAEPVDVARQEAAVPWGAVAEKESPVRHWESTG
jgi:hypothetical protein